MTINKKYTIASYTIISLFLFLVLILPVVSFAGLVSCNNTPDSEGNVPKADQCDFNALMRLVNNIIDFILYYLAIPICAIMFFYAGFLLVTAGGEVAHARTEAKSIFLNAFLGLVLAFAAWLIIKTVLSILGYNADWIGF